MMRRYNFVWLGWLLCLCVVGCSETEFTDGVGADAGSCDDCHRSEDNPAAEVDTEVLQKVADGHDLHAESGIGCEVCHTVPSHIAAPSHIDGAPAEVVFSGHAVDGQASAVWNAETKQCVGTYCHGGTTNGGTRTTPSWTAPLMGSTCTDCHGSPPATGAHARHTLTVPCSECHVLPLLGAPSMADHVDRYPAEVTLGPLSSRGGAAPMFEAATKRCTGTYCHGATLVGGTDPNPVWAMPSGSSAPCDSCHGNPPEDANHIVVADCYLCHAGTVNADGTINQATGQHQNGVVEDF